MTKAHWLFLAVLGAMTALLVCFACAAQPVGRAYRWTRRVFWAFAAVSLSGALGVMGVNGVTVGAAALLGWPGWAAMAVLRLL